MRFYSLTIFLSAFLLFQVQPLIAKHILPWYGGGSGVWATCMLFFQVMLLIGYTYAHWLSVKFDARRQAVVHAGVLLVSLPFLSFAPDPTWKPTGEESPILSILSLLFVHIGLPFTVLASTSPLIMRWFSRAFPDRPPYRLYALSNFGSFLALISYPFVVAPMLKLDVQERAWSMGYAAYVFLSAVCAYRIFHGKLAEESPESLPTADAQQTAPGRGDLLLWLALSAAGSVLLLATTNQMCTDLAAVPLLWVLPLAIYLLSFVISFERARWYQRSVFLPLFAISVSGVTFLTLYAQLDSLGLDIAFYSVALFAGTMVCHGELARAKPAATYLTGFYLALSAGGALGGIFVAIVAPLVFPDYWEYPLGLLVTGALAMICVRRRQENRAVLNKLFLRRLSWAAACIVWLGVAASFVFDAVDTQAGAIEVSRTFFGVIRVQDVSETENPFRSMVHGRTRHGLQFRTEAKRKIATTYYGRHSGVDVALSASRDVLVPPETGLRVAIVGLGTGTIAAHGRPGDLFRFYEIDPEVDRLARKHFTFMDDCEADVEVRYGDARIVLEREAAAGEKEFDVLIIDAFNSDAVPMHLLTQEAFAVYHSRLRPDGVLAINASNRYLDLSAVVRGLAEKSGHEAIRMISTGDPSEFTSLAHWVLVTNNSRFLENKLVKTEATAWEPQEMDPLYWTDDFGSLWSAMVKSRLPSKWASAPRGGRFVIDRSGLLSIEDKRQIQDRCRSLYSDTDGANPLLVVTVNSMADFNLTEEFLPAFAADMYQIEGMSKSTNDRGLLVLVFKEDRRATVHFGKGWPTKDHGPIRKILSDTVVAGFSNGQLSSELRKCVENLAQLIRPNEVSWKLEPPKSLLIADRPVSP